MGVPVDGLLYVAHFQHRLALGEHVAGFFDVQHGLLILVRVALTKHAV